MDSPRILPLPAPVSPSALPPPSVCHLLHPPPKFPVRVPSYSLFSHSEVAPLARTGPFFELPGAES